MYNNGRIIELYNQDTIYNFVEIEEKIILTIPYYNLYIRTYNTEELELEYNNYNEILDHFKLLGYVVINENEREKHIKNTYGNKINTFINDSN